MAVVDADYWTFNLTLPTYTKFFVDVFYSFTTSCSQLNFEHLSFYSWIDTAKRYGYVSQSDVALFLCMAVFWTAARYAVTIFILKPLLSHSNLGESETRKAPESAWKLIFYTSTWCYSTYLLFFSKYDFFFNPPLTFYKWRSGQPVPADIYMFYLVQLSFYLHSVYGTIFMDVWRRDSMVMLMHHLVTLLLIGFSYAFRFTNVGVLILFLHDVTDIILEFTKLVLYHKTKGGVWNRVCDAVSTVGFILFGLSWFVFRLYWYPLKAMYAAGHTSIVVMHREPPFYIFFNTLLWILLCMNVYWFKFIVVMAYYVVTGKAQEVGDVREYEEDSTCSGSANYKKADKIKRANGVMKKEL